MSARNVMIVTTLVVVAVMLCSCTPAPSEPVIHTVKVDVPTLADRHPPRELARKPVDSAALPTLVSPTNPLATACFTAESAAKMRALSIDREYRLDAWEKYGILK